MDGILNQRTNHNLAVNPYTALTDSMRFNVFREKVSDYG